MKHKPRKSYQSKDEHVKKCPACTREIYVFDNPAISYIICQCGHRILNDKYYYVDQKGQVKRKA